MSEEIENEPQTLGALLHDTRKKKNLSLDDVWEATKISKPIIKAMEADDHDSMPAMAFSRAFYVMYANFLNLDSENVLARYLENRGLSSTPSKDRSVPPLSKSGRFSSFAEPSAISPRTGATLLLLACVIMTVGTCWYLGYNPISYLSSKLSTTQKASPPPPPQVVMEQTVEAPTATVEKQAPDGEEEIVQNSSYHLEIKFHSAGTLTMTQDNGDCIDKQYENGDTMELDVEKAILLEMPEEIDASILLNGTELSMPVPVNGKRLLSLPEDVLN